MSTLYQTNPCLWDHEINNLGTPSIPYRYYMHNMPDLCTEVERKIFKLNNACKLHNYMAPPPASGVVDFIILVDPSIEVNSDCLIYAQG